MQGSREVDSYTCNVVMINLSRETQAISWGSELGLIVEVDKSDFATIQEVLHVRQQQVTVTNVEHVRTIKLDHLPQKYYQEYEN